MGTTGFAITAGVAVAALAASACKKEPAAPPPPPPPAVGTASPVPVIAVDAAPAPIACPADGAPLATATQAIFTLAAAPTEAHCTALFSHGVAAWILDAVAVGGVVHQAVVDAATGKTLSSSEFTQDDVIVYTYTPRTAVAFGGDGEQVLVDIGVGGAEGHATGSIEISALVDGKLRTVADLQYSYTDEGAVAGTGEKPSICPGTAQLIDGADGKPVIEVVAEKPRGKDVATCLKPGRHLYRFDGNALVELP